MFRDRAYDLLGVVILVMGLGPLAPGVAAAAPASIGTGTAAVLFAALRDGETERAVAGAIVSEYGVEKPDSTKSDVSGFFELSLKNQESPSIL
ncbi:MAG: hypothetical protein VX498_05415, partial [Myxococcota bacterium]|nr:hypothetical protein [Myxococcota bacterium]